MIYVYRDGRCVPKGSDRVEAVPPSRSDLPMPMISRMEPFESPVTGKEITSWRERDRDMAAAGAVDPRDLPPPTRGRKARKENDDARRTAGPDFEWGRLPEPG